MQGKVGVQAFESRIAGDNRFFRRAVAQTQVAVCLTDPALPDNPIVFVNGAFEHLTGYSSDEVLGRNCRFLQGPETDRAEVDTVREAIANEAVTIVELLNYRKNGERFVNALHLSPVYDERGALLYHFASQWDASELHSLRGAESRQRRQIEWLSRRLRNLLGVVNALVSLSVAPAQRRLGERIVERVIALGRAHEALFAAGGDEETIALEPLLRALLAPHLDEPFERLSLAGPPTAICHDLVGLLALLVHELARASSIAGVLGRERGRVALSWRVHRPHGGRHVELSWREESAASAPATDLFERSLDRALLGALVETVEGTLDVARENGAPCVRASFPLSTVTLR